MKYLILLFLVAGCQASNEQQKESDSSNQVWTSEKVDIRMPLGKLNITVLLDLSDRISPSLNPSNPEHFQRDTALICYLVDYLRSKMRKESLYMAKDKLKLILQPAPADANINNLVKSLSFDLARMDVKSRKVVYNTMKKTFQEGLNTVYSKAVQQADWPGSDLWRFFKNDVKDLAVDTDSSYRNILIIFTDGYIFHSDSRDKKDNRYAYILPELFDKYKLRQSRNWPEKIKELDFGLISKRADLQDLEILVLEVNPSTKYRNDEDIIREVLNKWFSEMKVKRWSIFNSDIPLNTTSKMEAFLQKTNNN